MPAGFETYDRKPGSDETGCLKRIPQRSAVGSAELVSTATTCRAAGAVGPLAFYDKTA
jgi:hypothetical protein